MELNELKNIINKAFNGEEYFLNGIIDNKDLNQLVNDYSFISLMDFRNHDFNFPISLTENISYDQLQEKAFLENKSLLDIIESVGTLVKIIKNKIQLFSTHYTERELLEIFSQEPELNDISVGDFELTQLADRDMTLSEQLGDIDPLLFDGYIVAEGMISDPKYGKIFNKAFRLGSIELLNLNDISNIYMSHGNDFSDEEYESKNEFDNNSAAFLSQPITIARHQNGSLHILDGNYRFNHAYKNKENSIKAYIFDAPHQLTAMLSSPELANNLLKK